MPRVVRVLLATGSAECVRAVRRAAGSAQWIAIDVDHRYGSAAISAAFAERPDICLLDDRLDGAGGLAQLREVRRMAGSIPIVLLQGAADASSVVARRAGAADCLVREDLTGEALERSFLWVLMHARADQVTTTAEKAARVRDAELQALADGVSTSIARYDQDYRHLSVSPGIDRPSHAAPGTFAGRTNRELGIASAVCDEWERAIASVFATGESTTLQVDLPSSAGPRRIELHLAPQTTTSGRVESVIEVRRDVTEERSLREQVCQGQKMDLMGRLASGIVHDFGNVLTAIIGYTQLVELTLDHDDARRADIAEIHAATARAADLTRQLLTFTRRSTPVTQAIDPNPTVAHVGKMLRRLIPENIELGIHCQPEIGCVRIDTGSLERLLLNLVVNARDAMPEGGSILVETTSLSVPEHAAGAMQDVPAGTYVAIAVTDGGVGIPDDVRARLFDPFFTTKETGTGLGLAVVQEIARQSHGRVVVESAPGQGSTFTILLPRVDAEVSAASSTDHDAMAGGNEAVLLVEDESTLRGLYARLLRQQGYSVIEAQDGHEAIDLLRDRERPVHLLITDVVMPRMGGCELARAVKSMQPHAKVLFMSGYPRGEVLPPSGRGARADDDEFIEKPFTAKSFLRKIRDLLDHPQVEYAPKLRVIDGGVGAGTFHNQLEGAL